MTITAKELAQKLNLSATAVSIALNNKPGVSTETRNEVIRAAEKYGYDFSRIAAKNHKDGFIYTVCYRRSNALTNYSPVFDELLNGIEGECRNQGYTMKILQFYEKSDDLQTVIETLRMSDCIGIVLLGAELTKTAGEAFVSLNLPIVILSAYFEFLKCNYVLIDNRQGAYLATDYLISRYMTPPGYLQSSYPLQNFTERKEGFSKAIHDNGLSMSFCIVHELPPSIEGSMVDMLKFIDSGVSLANCYFADNDLIAIGVIKAFKLRGYRIPEDIAIIGFDNIPEGRIIEPALTSINIPKLYMGQLAVKKLVDSIHTPVPYTSKTEVSTTLVKRFSA